MKKLSVVLYLVILFMVAFGCGAVFGVPQADEIIDDANKQEIETETVADMSEDHNVSVITEENVVLTETEVLPPEDEYDDEEEMHLIEDTPPPAFGFIDLHADTITRVILRNQNLLRNSLHVDFERLYGFGAPVQVFALWSSDRYVADAFNYTNSLIDYFEREVAKHSDMIEIALTLEDMERNARNNKISAILAIEGGEALMGKIENVDHFYNRGVRIMTLTWNRENALGFGQATNSTRGLKPFGFEVVKRMEELGMIVDISHINEAGFWDFHEASTRPYMASHSNSYSLTPHNRNLRDNQILALAERGGIVGLAFYPLLLTSSGSASIDDIIANIRHFVDLGVGDIVGLGGDLDGFGTMPRGLTDVSSFRIIAERVAEEFDETFAARFMSGNFHDFFIHYFD